MARFDQRMSASAGALMHHNADAVVYREPGRDPVSLQAILGFAATAEYEGEGGRKKRQVTDVTVRTDPTCASGGIANPALHGWFEIDGVEYSIKEIMSRSKTFIRIAVEQTRAIERSRANVRRR